MPDDRPEVQYVTLAQARALSCNGCGDCCDSRRTDGFWTWGVLPADLFRSMTGGEPLIIPLERFEGGWRERAHREVDTHELAPTPFRCTAFTPHEDGTGGCARHDQWRPPPCHAFPVWGDDLVEGLRERPEVPLETSAFPRCTWYRMTVVRDGDERASG